MRREIVQDQVYALAQRIAFPHQLQHLQKLARTLPFSGMSPQLVGMDVVKSQPVANSMLPSVGCRQPIWALGRPPALAGLRTDLQGAKLVEGNRRAIGGRPIHITANHFFLDANFGSLHSFQVFVRRSRTFADLRIRRIVSMLIESTIF